MQSYKNTFENQNYNTNNKLTKDDFFCNITNDSCNIFDQFPSIPTFDQQNRILNFENNFSVLKNFDQRSNDSNNTDFLPLQNTFDTTSSYQNECTTNESSYKNVSSEKPQKNQDEEIDMFDEFTSPIFIDFNDNTIIETSQTTSEFQNEMQEETSNSQESNFLITQLFKISKLEEPKNDNRNERKRISGRLGKRLRTSKRERSKSMSLMRPSRNNSVEKISKQIKRNIRFFKNQQYWPKEIFSTIEEEKDLKSLDVQSANLIQEKQNIRSKRVKFHSKYKEYTVADRMQVKKFFNKALKVARKNPLRNKKQAFKKAFKETKENFKYIYGESLMKSWINKADITDDRHNNQGKPFKYTVFNKDFVKELPKLILQYNGKFQQQVIFKKMVFDIYYKNQSNYQDLIKPEDVQYAMENPKKPKTFSKGWFNNLKNEYKIKFTDIRRIGKTKKLFKLSINGQIHSREDFQSY